MIKTILFDMDGVIADTDRTRFWLLQKILKKDYGLKAAQAAGIICLAVTYNYGADELTEADAVIGSLDELNKKYIENFLIP